MNQEERKQKIDSILEEVKRHGRMSGNGIPIELWMAKVLYRSRGRLRSHDRKERP